MDFTAYQTATEARFPPVPMRTTSRPSETPVAVPFDDDDWETNVWRDEVPVTAPSATPLASAPRRDGEKRKARASAEEAAELTGGASWRWPAWAAPQKDGGMDGGMGIGGMAKKTAGNIGTFFRDNNPLHYLRRDPADPAAMSHAHQQQQKQQQRQRARVEEFFEGADPPSPLMDELPQPTANASSAYTPSRMVVDMTLYDRLGVSCWADAADIKKSYHRLAVLHHPDKNPGADAEEKVILLIFRHCNALTQNLSSRASLKHIRF